MPSREDTQNELIKQQQSDKKRLNEIQTRLKEFKHEILTLETERERLEQQIKSREQEISQQIRREGDSSQAQLQEDTQLGMLKEIWFFPHGTS